MSEEIGPESLVDEERANGVEEKADGVRGEGRETEVKVGNESRT
jgi:hypothetical protein